MKKIRVGVVGYGYWGPNLVRNFFVNKMVDSVTVCDTDRQRLNTAQTLYPHIVITQDFQTILKDSSIDLVAIATPVSTHYKLAKIALTAKKHVLIEKPMTTSSKEARELIALAKKVNRQLFVGHTFVYSEPVKYLKKLVTTNALGKIYYFDSTRINLGLLQSDTNVLWDLAPHDFSIITYLFSESPKSVYAVGSSFLRDKVEELVHIFITLENNISCHIQLSWLSPIKIRNIILAGSQKMVTYDDIQPVEKIRVYDKGVTFNKDQITPFNPAYRSGDLTIPSLKQNEALYNELSHFIDCILTKKKPLTGGPEGLRVVKLIEAAQLSLKTGKKVIIHAREK